MLKKSFITIAVVLLVVFAANAEVPNLVNYQGMLTDADGTPIDGTRSIEFSFYATLTGGSALWTETHKVTVTEGLFSVLLGSVTPLDFELPNNAEIFIEIKVGSDPAMTPRKQMVSAGFALLSDDSDHLEGHRASDFVRKVDDVSPQNGNVDLVAGSNITISPDAGNHRITISASGGSSGDNLGNHTATQNIKLNGKWLSNDGGSEGLKVDNSGNVTASRAISVGSPSAAPGTGDISVADDLLVDDHVLSKHITAYDGWIKTGSPSSSVNNGDIVATKNLKADDDIQSGKEITAAQAIRAGTHLIANNGYIRTGSPSVSYGNGDIVATDEIVADNTVRTGSPSMSYGSGDIVATDDLICDDDAIIGDKLIVYDHAGINAGAHHNTYALYVYGNSYCTGSWLGSDIKFKNNIKNIENPLSLLLNLNGVSYNWKTKEYKEREFSEGRHYGLIAQEVEKVLPDMVKEDDNGEKAIAYTELIPLLLEAIKQQQKDIEQLQNKVNQLMNK